MASPLPCCGAHGFAASVLSFCLCLDQGSLLLACRRPSGEQASNRCNAKRLELPSVRQGTSKHPSIASCEWPEQTQRQPCLAVSTVVGPYVRPHRVWPRTVDPFRTALPFWGQIKSNSKLFFRTALAFRGQIDYNSKLFFRTAVPFLLPSTPYFKALVRCATTIVKA